jgi:hypothetical protein
MLQEQLDHYKEQLEISEKELEKIKIENATGVAVEADHVEVKKKVVVKKK